MEVWVWEQNTVNTTKGASSPFTLHVPPRPTYHRCVYTGHTHLHLRMHVAYVWRFHYNMLWTLCSNCLDEKLRSITCCVTKDVLVFQLLSSIPQNTSDDDNQFAGLLWRLNEKKSNPCNLTCRKCKPLRWRRAGIWGSADESQAYHLPPLWHWTS